MRRRFAGGQLCVMLCIRVSCYHNGIINTNGVMGWPAQLAAFSRLDLQSWLHSFLSITEELDIASVTLCVGRPDTVTE